MKKVITRVIAHWEGETICEDGVVTDEKLEREQENLNQYIVEALGLNDENIYNVDISVAFEVREVEEK